MLAFSAERVALGLALGFLALAVVLMALVKLAFRVARERYGDRIFERPDWANTHWFSRGFGVFLMLAGCGFAVWSWQEAHSGRFFQFRMAVIGPAFLGMGAWLVVEGPLPTEPRPTPLGWSLTFLGLVAGLLYVEYLRTGRLPSLP